jgi:haloalkane dehalogenase
VDGQEIKRAAGLAYREAEPPEGGSGDPVLMLHGFPESSYMWRELLPHVERTGRRALAPDLPGFGDSPPREPNSWEACVEAVDAFVADRELGPVVLVVHDWGGLIGLRWACETPGSVSALVICDTGFFPDGKWHGMAEALRTPGTGEDLLAGLNREGYEAVLKAASPNFTDDAIEEYWRAASQPANQRAVLDLYRSGDFEKIAPLDGALGRLGVPTRILWGENDEFAPVAGARRFQDEIPGSNLTVIPGAGHFVFADAPQRCCEEVESFLATLPR